jgi:ABC-2 type transport system permease protein
MSATLSVYGRWIRDRRLSTVSWTLGIIVIIVATAAFYPSLGSATASIADGSNSGEAMSSLLGLSSGIDPSTPLGYLWISLYANIVPWTLMALGVALGTAAIASDEDTGALEYLLSGPVTRTQVAFARFAAAVSVLLLVSFLSGVSMVLSLPFFDLTESVTTTAADGSTTTAPGATVGDIAAGTFSSFAVALGLTGIAFLIGAATGRKGITLGVASAIGIGGYVLYTLSSMTSSLDFLTWLSPWRWYVDDVMLINGLTWDVTLPFITATLSLLIGWQAFLHRDLQSS